jgi:hypothetical protein
MKTWICVGILLVALLVTTGAWADATITYGGNSANGVIPGGIAPTDIVVTGSGGSLVSTQPNGTYTGGLYAVGNPDAGLNYDTWTGDWNGLIPQFNPAAGTLDSVTLELHTTNGVSWYAIGGTSGQTVNVVLEAMNVLGTPAGGTGTTNTPGYIDNHDTLGVGSTINGVSDVTAHGDNEASNGDSGAISQADLADYIGTGTVSGLTIASTDFSSGTGGSAAYTLTPSSLDGLTVTYDYSPSVPEPSSLALLLTGLPMGMLVMRRRRPKK